MNISNSLRIYCHNRKVLRSGLSLLKKVTNRLMAGRIIFILGCQRSGTTLLYMLLSSHPAVFGYNEDELSFDFPRLGILLHSALHRAKQGRYSCFKLPTKTPELEIFQDEYKHSKIFWIIRHPYSVISSMRSLIIPRTGENWLKTHGRVELKRHSKMFPEINEIDFEKIDEVTLGAYIYHYKFLTLQEYEARQFDLYIIKFEELVKNIQNTLMPVFIDIGLGWSESILSHQKQHKMKRYPGNNIGSRPVDKSRINPNLNLNLGDMEKIKSICGVHIKKYYIDD